jgi:hypothetical protein
MPREGVDRKLDQSAARKVFYRKDVHSTPFAHSRLSLVRLARTAPLPHPMALPLGCNHGGVRASRS